MSLEKPQNTVLTHYVALTGLVYIGTVDSSQDSKKNLSFTKSLFIFARCVLGLGLCSMLGLGLCFPVQTE